MTSANQPTPPTFRDLSGSNVLSLRLGCDMDICIDGERSRFIPFRGAVLTPYGDNDFARLATLDFTFVSDLHGLRFRDFDMHGGMPMLVFDVLFTPDGDLQPHTKEASQRDDPPSSLIIIDELSIEKAVQGMPLCPWIVDTLSQAFFGMERLLIAHTEPPEHETREGNYDQLCDERARMWESAGLRPISGTDFLVHHIEHVLPQLPPLPKLETMLSEEQLKSLHYDHRTFGKPL